MKDNNEKSKKLFSELRPLFDNLDPKLKNLSTEDIFSNAFKAQTILKKPNEKILKKAQDFFEQAKKDLGSSKTLYNAKDFGNSAYLFQQSIEKACKAYGLKMGFIKNTREIKHESPLVFINGLKRTLIDTKMIDMLEKFTGQNESEKIINAYNLVKSDPKDLAKMSLEQLELQIKLVNKLPEVFLNTMKDKLAPIEQLIELFMPGFEQILNMTIVPFKLYILSIVSYPHWNRAHYPDTSYLSSKNYNPDLPLIKKLPEFHKISEATFKDLNSFFFETN
jgi:HEPN domain-containing protein